MIVEIIITLLIIGFAARIIYKNIKNRGKCECTSCSNHCKNYKKPENK